MIYLMFEFMGISLLMKKKKKGHVSWEKKVNKIDVSCMLATKKMSRQVDRSLKFLFRTFVFTDGFC